MIGAEGAKKCFKRFEVKNFKNFDDWFVFDLSDTKSYEFNSDCVEDGIAKKALIYGPNGCGKTNLGRALFEIKTHLTDDKIDEFYSSNYLNANSSAELAEFKYTFQFGNTLIEYHYGKQSVGDLVYESFFIDGEEVISLDRRKSADIDLNITGIESLNTDLTNKNISAVKYVNNNSTMTSESLQIISAFIVSIHLMTLASRFPSDSIGPLPKDILEDIGSLNGLESFLCDAGVACKLTTILTNDGEVVAFQFNEKAIEFQSIASKGTISLALLYIRIASLKKTSELNINGFSKSNPFIFVDEFDAFYHHAASEFIVRAIRGIDNCQAVLTTHNTSIMSNDLLRPDCYFIMSEDDIKPMHRFTDKELRKAHNIEKMYKAGAFNG